MLYLGDTNLLVGCQKRKITTVDLTLAKVTSEVSLSPLSVMTIIIHSMFLIHL